MPSLSEVFSAAKRSRDDKPAKDRTDTGHASDMEPEKCSITNCIKTRYDMMQRYSEVKPPSPAPTPLTTHSHVVPDAGPTQPHSPPAPKGPAGSSPTHSPGHGAPHGGENLNEGHEHPGLEATRELSNDMVGKEVTDFAATVGHTAKGAVSSLAGVLGHQKTRLSAAEAGGEEANPLIGRFTAAMAAHGISFRTLANRRKGEMQDGKQRYGYVPGFTGRGGALGGGGSAHGATVPATTGPHRVEHAPRSMVNKVLTRTVGPGVANAVAPRKWGGDLGDDGKTRNAQPVVSMLERLQEHASPAQLHQTGGQSSQGTGGGYRSGIHQDSMYQPPGALGKNPYGK